MTATRVRKHVKERRERLRKLGEQDAADRCGFCKRNRTLRIGAFCSYDCERDAAEAAEQRKAMEARR